VSWFGRDSKKKLDEQEAYVDAVAEEVRARQPRVTALVEWLEQRKISNGFGEDFELTLKHPRRLGG
jgi:hypothetical protein